MKDKIIAAIAEYLYHFTESTNDFKKVRFLKAVRHDKTREDFLQEIAAEIAAAIAPLVNMQAQDFAGWICHQVVAGRTYHKLWLDYCEEKAIAPLVEAGNVDWKAAPPWANWRTVDDDGTITFWELEPVLDDNQFFLNDNGGRKMLVLRPLDKQQRPK